jgi:hypothetical protein
MSDPHGAIDAARFTLAIQQITNQYFAEMQKRHDAGQEKYGPVGFTHADTLEKAMQELVDLGNYAMYTYIKCALLSEDISRLATSAVDELGVPSFRPSKDGFNG